MRSSASSRARKGDATPRSGSRGRGRDHQPDRGRIAGQGDRGLVPLRARPGRRGRVITQGSTSTLEDTAAGRLSRRILARLGRGGSGTMTFASSRSLTHRETPAIENARKFGKRASSPPRASPGSTTGGYFTRRYTRVAPHAHRTPPARIVVFGPPTTFRVVTTVGTLARSGASRGGGTRPGGDRTADVPCRVGGEEFAGFCRNTGAAEEQPLRPYQATIGARRSTGRQLHISAGAPTEARRRTRSRSSSVPTGALGKGRRQGTERRRWGTANRV